MNAYKCWPRLLLKIPSELSASFGKKKKTPRHLFDSCERSPYRRY